MRKFLITVLIVLLLAMFTVMISRGILIGNFSVGHSIQSLVKKNGELDNNINALEKEIKQGGYSLAKSDLDASYQRLKLQKQEYQNKIAYTTEEEIKDANKTEQYKLEYLWTTIGLYATQNNLTLKADLSHASSGVDGQYNISITAQGEYISISEFVYAIEKDSNLGFRIEEFALVPYSEEQLQATFMIKNVTIDPNSLSVSKSLAGGNSTNNMNNNNNPDANTNTNANANANQTNTPNGPTGTGTNTNTPNAPSGNTVVPAEGQAASGNNQNGNT